MNFLPLVLGFLLLKTMPSFGLANNNNGQSQQEQKAQRTNKDGGILNNLEDAQQALQLVSIFNKIKENKADISEVMGEIMTNPIAMNIISKMGFGGQQDFDVQPCNEEQSFTYEAPENNQQLNVNKTESEQAQNTFKQPTCEAKSQLVCDEKPVDGQVFENIKTPADTLFKPVENIAGVELTKQLKKYYENWYVN